METRVLHIFSGIDEEKYFKGKDLSLLSKKEKDRIDNRLHLKEIKKNGLLVYKNGFYGRVIQIGQKNFKIERKIT